MLKINNLDEAAAAVLDAQQQKHRLEVRGLGTKTGIGNQPVYDACLDVSAMQGIVDYQPEELVLTLRAGTALSAVESALDKANQMLAFEPADLSGLLKSKSTGTIGGVLATNLSGPRRLTAGAARDFLLGFDAVSGRGERFKSGGRVMKNVTGYDLSKLICGSYGTLAVIDEVTIKTLPRPETSLSLLFESNDMASAVALIAGIFASPHEPGAAAILPQPVAAATGIDLAADFVVVIRLEGIALSVDDRAGHLRGMGGICGISGTGSNAETVPQASSETLWRRIRDVDLLADHAGDIWKLSCPPASAPQIIAAIEPHFDMTFYADWAGGLLWLAGPSGADFGNALRAALALHGGGHAQLICDRDNSKKLIPALQPLPTVQASLSKRVKAAFDPLGVLNFGRMHDGI
ncbi:FAD-binding protein [Alphaproteobacteria bacterium]|nr:FAD-binding protein [Alphaproteobacteria bacterium]